MSPTSHFTLLLAVAVTTASAGGCGLIGGPRNTANIELRKENATLREQARKLELQVQAGEAALRSHDEKVGTLQTLPRERLATLFTTHDLRLGRLTGGADLDPKQPGQEGIKVYATPIDGTGDPLKAAGTFTIEAFDLSREGNAKVGAWTFDVETAARHWTSVLNRYNYVLPCPWQTPPTSGSLHVVVTFVDELTRGVFKKSVDVTVELPPTSGSAPESATAPTSATAPASAPAAGG